MLETMVKAALEVAWYAASRIMQSYLLPASATEKADGSPLTAADAAAHEAIAAGLAAFSALPVVSEEGAAAHPGGAGASYWLVDPLDGTREFLDRNGEFTVNIALIEDGQPVLGVVVAPALGTAYWAARGEGAFVARDGGGPEPIETVEGSSPLRVAVSRSHSGDALPGFLSKLGPHTTVSMGSSLKLCLVAEGRADLYPRLGTTSEWDIAAADCILAEAGGILTAIDGSLLAYGKADVRNPWFLASGSVAVHRAARAAIAATLETAG